MSALPRIETRDQLLSMLAEAAELEHNLMCLYLYAVFSLKTRVEEGLSVEELKLVTSWRKVIMGVCVQEMSHLAIVSNLATSVGGNAHMFRSNFPIRSGYFPSDFVIELVPFNLDTLDHFIFLERPADSALEDSEAMEGETYSRGAPRSRLMTHGGDYSTVGELYECIQQGITHLSQTLGPKVLFCGDPALQLTAVDVSIEGMEHIHDESSALRAISRIVEEGEGGDAGETSHFQKFTQIKSQYTEALDRNANFVPARPAARNPVMRKPAVTDDVIWINDSASVLVLDLANALYDLMLRCLTLIYTGEARPKGDRDQILSLTFQLMKSLGIVASHLSTLPANKSHVGVTAGLTFTTNRHFLPPLIRNEKTLLRERLAEILGKSVCLPSDLQRAVRKILSVEL